MNKVLLYYDHLKQSTLSTLHTVLPITARLNRF